MRPPPGCCALRQAFASARIISFSSASFIGGPAAPRGWTPPNQFAMAEFPRITRLPPYVFNITTELKMAARRRGEDIIDFGMGNPDGPTPQHIVDKLVETVRRPDTHRYSVSKGIPRLRKAICDWYRRRYG